MAARIQDLKQQKFVLDVEPTDLVGYPSSSLDPSPRPAAAMTLPSRQPLSRLHMTAPLSQLGGSS